MTQLSLFRSACAHEATGRFLYYGGFIRETERAFRAHANLPAEESIAERFGLFAPSDTALKPFEGYTPPDYARYFADMAIPPRAFINRIGVLEVPGSAFHFTQYISPLRNAVSLADVTDFPFLCAQGFTDDHMAADVAAAHAAGRVARTWVGHIYEDSWQIRGYEQFLMDLCENPDIPRYILSRVAEQRMKTAVAAAKAGVDIITTGDDVATQRAMIMRPDTWREVLKPLWSAIYAAARSIKPDIQIWYHSDGDILPIIPDLIEMGVTILNPVQPECMDTDFIKREYGKHLVLDGLIGTQTTMPFGSPDDVRRAVRDTKKRLGADGAVILSPTHVLEPDVPPENILAFFETCAEEA